MDHETLFTATKWDILKALERKPQSPIEIAKSTQGSIANISQQLRLLEMAGLVTSRRVGNRDKDKPRILYSLNGNVSYMIAAGENFVDKKMVSLSDRNKIILRIWFLDDAALRYSLEKTFWAIESHLDGIEALSFVGTEKGHPVLEYAGSVMLPSVVVIGGSFADVCIRRVEQPAGHVLYARS